jgi:hypothetical protein
MACLFGLGQDSGWEVDEALGPRLGVGDQENRSQVCPSEAVLVFDASQTDQTPGGSFVSSSALGAPGSWRTTTSFDRCIGVPRS